MATARRRLTLLAELLCQAALMVLIIERFGFNDAC